MTERNLPQTATPTSSPLLARKPSTKNQTSRSKLEKKGSKIISSLTGVCYTSPASLLMKEVKSSKIAEQASKRTMSNKPNSSETVHQIIQNSKVGESISSKDRSSSPSYDVHIRPSTSKVPHPFSSTANEFFEFNKQIIENASPIYNKNLVKAYCVPQISLKMKEILIPVAEGVTSSHSVSESLRMLNIKSNPTQNEVNTIESNNICEQQLEEVVPISSLGKGLEKSIDSSVSLNEESKIVHSSPLKSETISNKIETPKKSKHALSPSATVKSLVKSRVVEEWQSLIVS
nr:unnamed protein product [Naegleria fowleri]